MKHKFLAAGIHSFIALTAMAILTLICILQWYPGVLFEPAGGSQGLKLTFFLTTLTFPVLTFIIYKPKKKGLIFDLVTISIIHLSAFSFAAYTLNEEKPYLLVIVENSIYTLTKNDVDILGYAPVEHTRWVYVDLPLHKGQIKAIQFASELMDSRGLAARSDLYIPINLQTTKNFRVAFQTYLMFFSEKKNTCHKLYLHSKLSNTAVCLDPHSLELKNTD